MQSAISIRNVQKSFGDVRALDGVSLEIKAGEFFGLLGPNGAGKTTLLRILSGLMKADGGEAEFAKEADLSAQRPGVVPQEIALYEMLSAEQNLEIFGTLHGLRGASLQGRIAATLEMAGLESQRKRRVKTYSGGMKRRLNLAVGLIHDPAILMLDEPTVGVDPQSRAKIFDLLEELRRAGKTIIYTTHYMEEAERLCDRIGIIDHGRVAAVGALTELLERVRKPRFVRLHGTGDAEKIPEFAQTKVERGHNHWDLIPDSAVDLGRLIKDIEQSGLPHNRMEIVSPNLETLFLELAGSELRDE
jgi:ABC-2 type transport system ATP-binding protein